MRARGPHLIVLIAVLAPGWWCLGSTLAGTRVFAYRDAVHFYYPLYAWITDRWAAGDVPLWNPYDNNGNPLLAESTAALFYPGKLVFALPGDYAWRYNLYIMLHLLLAAGGAYALARCWTPGRRPAHAMPARGGHSDRAEAGPGDDPDPPLSVPASGLCAVSYAWGGIVLFQYCNVVFLVGAAWLPVALLATHRMFRRQSPRWAVGLGICLAMMVLGGDPQAAYHSGLFAVLGAVLMRRDRELLPADDRDRRGTVRWATIRLGLLALAALSGLLLSALHVVPASGWIRQSERAMFSRPRSLYEIRSFLVREGERRTNGVDSSDARWREVAAGLFGEPLDSEHHGQLYHFSVAPWRLVETVWPNVSGRGFPVNHRWLSAIGGEDRVWVPSLYGGILPLLLGLAAWRPGSSQPRVRWMAWIGLLSVTGSFGWYGLGWIVRGLAQVVPMAGIESELGPPTGGLYWLLVILLPGYAQFRYPAKWLVPAALACACLAGIGLDRMLKSDRRAFANVLVWVGVLSLLLAVLVVASVSWWPVWLASSRPDELFGPVDPRGAWRDTWMACLHVACVCGGAWWLVRRRLSASVLGSLLLLLTAVELGWANRWMVLTAPRSVMETRSVVETRAMLSGEPDRGLSENVYRRSRRDWVPGDWKRVSSPTRVEEQLRWDLATLYGKLNLLGPGRSLATAGTLDGADYRAFLNVLGGEDPHPVILNILGAEFWILPSDASWPRHTGAQRLSPMPWDAVGLWRNPAAHPLAWIVHHLEPWPPPNTTDPRLLRSRLREQLFPAGRARDFRQLALVDPDTFAAWEPPARIDNAEAGEFCRIVGQSATRIELDVLVESAGMVVINQLYDPRWTVEIVENSTRSRRGRVVRTNHIMQGVVLPPGSHRLMLRFVPVDFFLAAAVSALSWLAAIAFLVPFPVRKVRASDLVIRRRRAFRGGTDP